MKNEHRQLLLEIEQLRNQLTEVVATYRVLTHPNVLKVSQLLDEAVLKQTRITSQASKCKLSQQF